MHRYEYDADNRLTHVYTSDDGIIWEKEAKYWYYKHGPLARTEIGDLDVQGMDYAYTLQGWVKGINSNILEAANDLGRDNMDDVSALEKNIHKNFGEDAASYSIGYFSGDYVAINSNYANFVAGIGSAGLATEAPDLYNGNINHMVTTIRNNAYAAQPQLTAYRYDQLNRIKQMRVQNAISNNVWDGSWIDRYKTMYDYDANGNIMSLIRHGGLSPFVKIDDMKYHYNSNDNRLQYIDDPNNPTSEPNFSGQSAGNYQYDAIGNMIADESGKISEIKWNVYGKISQILKDHTEETATPLDDIEFRYDATGNRVAKIIKPAASLDNPQTWKYTFYVRDAQGNILATYTKDGSNEIKLGEYNLYGSSRLGTANYSAAMSNLSWQNSGIYSRTLGLKRYEISNHLGNVLTVFSDKKITLTNNHTTPYILSTTDYDPFGMIMNGRDWNPGEYRFGFNGQEKDQEIYNNQSTTTATFWEYDGRIGRRWNRDPKSNMSISQYAVFANNPIFYSDPLGDTLKVFSGVLNSKGGKWKEGQERLFLFTLDDNKKKVDNIIFNSDKYKEINPQWVAENGRNYMKISDINKNAFIKYGAGPVLTPSQLTAFINHSIDLLHNSFSYKYFGWGNISKFNNYDHGEQGDIKAKGNLLDNSHLTLYYSNSCIQIIPSNYIGNFVFGVVAEIHGDELFDSMRGGDFLQNGGKDDEIDSYFLKLGHQSGKLRKIPSLFNSKESVPILPIYDGTGSGNELIKSMDWHTYQK